MIQKRTKPAMHTGFCSCCESDTMGAELYIRQYTYETLMKMVGFYRADMQLTLMRNPDAFLTGCAKWGWFDCEKGGEPDSDRDCGMTERLADGCVLMLENRQKEGIPYAICMGGTDM